jgi:hypothetical protein
MVKTFHFLKAWLTQINEFAFFMITWYNSKKKEREKVIQIESPTMMTTCYYKSF